MVLLVNDLFWEANNISLSFFISSVLSFTIDSCCIVSHGEKRLRYKFGSVKRAWFIFSVSSLFLAAFKIENSYGPILRSAILKNVCVRERCRVNSMVQFCTVYCAACTVFNASLFPFCNKDFRVRLL